MSNYIVSPTAQSAPPAARNEDAGERRTLLCLATDEAVKTGDDSIMELLVARSNADTRKARISASLLTVVESFFKVCSKRR